MKIYIAIGPSDSPIFEDTLRVDQDYIFMGCIVDMSGRKDHFPEIPEVPYVKTKMLDDGVVVRFWNGVDSRNAIAGQDLFECKAGDFQKIPTAIAFSLKNEAILNYIKSIDPHTAIMIEMSW